jgi:hypothetical protein
VAKRKAGPGRQVVVVEWSDASYQRGECTEAELVPRVEIVSAGLLVREDAGSITIALDRYEADGLWRYIEHIPKACVRRVRRMVPQHGRAGR